MKYRYSILISCQQDSNIYDLPVDKTSTSSHGLKCYMFLWQANGSCKKTKLLHQGRTESKLLHWVSHSIWLDIGNAFQAKKIHILIQTCYYYEKKLREKELITTWNFATEPNVLHKKQIVKIFVDYNHLSLILQDFFYFFHFTTKKVLDFLEGVYITASGNILANENFFLKLLMVSLETK